MRLRQWPLDHIDIFGSGGESGRVGGRGSHHLTPITTDPTAPADRGMLLAWPTVGLAPDHFALHVAWHFQSTQAFSDDLQ